MIRPDLDSIGQFVVIARHLNFRRAAAEIGVAPSTLSERMRSLESQLDRRLFNRSTRSVALTAEGQRLLEAVADPLGRLDEALAGTGRDPDVLSGTIRLNGPRPAVELQLMPHVSTFIERNPEVRFEIVTEGETVDVVAGGFDAGLRYEDLLEQDMIAVRIGPDQRMVIAGHADYLSSRGAPTQPADLSDHDCIVHRFGRGNRLPWSLERDGQTIEFQPEGRIVANAIETALQALRGGLGLGYVFEDYIAADLDHGTLATVLDDWTPAFSGPSLYYPDRRLLPPAFRAFVDHVKARVRAISRDA